MWVYILLGAIQGVFEWIPVSSEGVVAVSSRFLIKDFNSVDLALFLHLGTLLAVLAYFWRDWLEIATLKNIKLLKFIAVATFASLIVGYPAYLAIRSLAVGNFLLMATGLGLLSTAYLSRAKKRTEVSFGYLALLAGFLQGLSVIPGLSRSGATIFGLSLGKQEPKEVLKLSYLMSAPVVLISSLYLFLQNPVLAFETWPALIASFAVGILTLGFLLKISQRLNFFKFALVFGLLCILGGLLAFIF